MLVVMLPGAQVFLSPVNRLGMKYLDTCWCCEALRPLVFDVRWCMDCLTCGRRWTGRRLPCAGAAVRRTRRQR